MRKINTLIILLIALGVVTKAQNFNNIFKELRDTSWRTGGNLSNVNIHDYYKYNKCIDLGKYVIIGERDSHNLKQEVVIQVDEIENFKQELLPNIADQGLYHSPNTYVACENYVIGSSRTIIYPSGSVSSELKPFIIEKNEKGDWVFKNFIEVDEKKKPGQFGMSVAIEGDWFIVSSSTNSTDQNGENKLKLSGAVYIFKKVNNEWKFYQKITANERIKGGKFGLTVDIHEKTIFVGSRTWGSVYLFKIDESEKWKQTQKLSKINSDGAAYTGIIKIVNGEMVMLTDGTFKNSGGIYIFKNNNGEWIESQYIQPSNLGNIDCFGGVQKYQERHISSKKFLVTANNEYMFVGVPQQNGKKQNSGAVYVYKKKNDGTWFKAKKIVHENPQFNQHFGKCVLVKDNLLFIGYNEMEVNSVLRIIKFQ